MNIKLKLIISYLILIICTVGLLGFLIGKRSEKAVFDEVIEKNKSISELIESTLSVRNDLLVEKNSSDINFGNHLIDNLGDLHVDYSNSIKIGDFDLPVLYAGNYRLSLDTSLIDSLTESTGAISSIYLLNDSKLIRVSTTLTKDNKRALGTFIPSDSIIYKKIINNEEFSGLIKFDGKSYTSKLKPLLDKNKNVIGAIGLGNALLNNYLEKTLSEITIGKTGYVYVIDSTGKIIIHPDDKGENASKYDFVQKIISTKNGTIEYTYKGIKKFAYYTYFKQWDWYIVTTANYDDLKSSSKSIFYSILFSAFIIILLGTFIALFIADTLVKPINKLKTCMEIAGKGDLTIRSDINSNDEIGILSSSFNNMMDENKQLLEEIIIYDKLKTEFISNMSHELKTPLNIIFSTTQLFSYYINNGENSNNIDKLNRYTNTMKQNCYRLLRLVNNLIDITKIDSGFMELNLCNQNIVNVAESITLSTADYIQSMSRTIIFDTDSEEIITAFDEEKLERILLNLISNAVKFTKPGGIIEVKLYDKDTCIEISVKDNGKGIPENKLNQLFQRFKQIDPLLSRSHEGSGIGLSIVKSLVEMHGGTITVKSKYTVGTEFIITLPIKLLPKNYNSGTKKSLDTEINVEKIQIEFSDIYN